MLLRVADGKLLLQVKCAVVKPFKRALGGFACQALCGFRLRRPHLTCLFCRRRRVYYGKLTSELSVSPYVLLIARKRRFARAKDALLKWLLTLAEWLAN